MKWIFHCLRILRRKIMKKKSEILESEIDAKKSKKKKSKKDAKKNSEKEKQEKNSADKKKKKSKEKSAKKGKDKNSAKHSEKDFCRTPLACLPSFTLQNSRTLIETTSEKISRENEIAPKKKFADEAIVPQKSNSKFCASNNSQFSTFNSQFSDEIISLENVKRIYAMGDTQVQALRGISFKINQGEFVTIMGPSGSGKSTCMNMIGCLDRPSEGVVKINGRETALMNEKELSVLRNQTVGFVFQQYFLLPSMNVLENVMLPLRYSGIERRERIALAKAALAKMGLQDRMSHRPSELSGGQKQRVAIARATVTNPKIILADEPTGALDSETGRAVMNLFWEINSSGTTVVIVTHDPRIGEASRRCIKIFDGKILSDDRQMPKSLE